MFFSLATASQGSIWLSVAKPQLTADATRTPTAGYGRLTYPHSIRICPTPTVVDVTLMRIGLIKKLTRFSSIEATQNAKDRVPFGA